MDLTLTLEPRTITGKKVKNLRKQGLIPASICGKGIESQSFQLDAKTFGLVYRRVGRTGLINLQMPDSSQSAFVRQVQIHPVSRQPIHVDFRIVDLRTVMAADVPLVATGENPLIERDGGVLQLLLNTLHVRGLPTDLPQVIEVDVSRIADFNTTLHVSDLDLGPNVEVLTPAEDVIATITPSRTQADAEQIAESIAEGDMTISQADADNNPDAASKDDEDQ